MKSWQTVLLIAVAFALGAATMWSLNGRQAQQVDTIFRGDPFADFESLREEMQQSMDAFMTTPMFPDLPATSTWPSVTQSRLLNSGQLTFDEDDEYVYFELDTGDNEVSHVDVSTENGYLTIQAELESRSGNSYSTSRLTRTMPVPATADVDTLEILTEDDQIIIRMARV